MGYPKRISAGMFRAGELAAGKRSEFSPNVNLENNTYRRQ
jgi:hypothetical protein